MAKKIVILLDGTSNEIKSNRSNVVRLYGTLKKTDEQVVYYDPGVGTFGADNAWSRWLRKAVEVWGLATGWGLDANVKEAYRFLVENYQRDEDGTRDEIYLFGFSRGAYTARVLAGFIHTFGLMEPRNLNLLDYTYRAFTNIGEKGDEKAFEGIRLHERILRPDRPPIRFLGLFDTVSSVIESTGLRLRLQRHANTANNTSVQTIRHALAIDERRTMFRPQLWPAGQRYNRNRFAKDEGEPQELDEVWFAGVHGDVGGGYPEPVSGLAKLPLAWMIEGARAAGLEFKTRTINTLVLGQDDRYAEPDPNAAPQDSMTAAWTVLEYLPRRKPADSSRTDVLGWIIPLKEPRHIPEGATVHASVLGRPERPVNLPQTIETAGAEDPSR